nr:4-oxalocrotonate tautomerase family protein [Geothermobacter hydrogeniphilus]
MPDGRNRKMPFVNIKLTTGVSTEQKQKLIAGVTDLLVRVLNKNPASTHVVIEEIDPENWGISGESVARLRQRKEPGVSGS